jgi:radical SAM protein with 4Fe4S-binding SPASM domain
MDHTSITSSPTFCPAPWTSLNIDQAGRVTPCFHCTKTVGNIKEVTIQEVITGSEWTKMKTAMSQGEWYEGCNWCKRLEDTTGTSGRTVRRAEQDTLTAIDNNLEFFKLEHLVVNWSNLCNLACVYCNDETSTAWQSINKIPINHVKNEHQDLIELAKTQGHNIQGLSLGGGEPLLQKGLGEFLDYLDPNKVNVMVTTNLSMELTANPIYQKLKDWPHVDWMISFDNANREKFEYVRHNAEWAQFVKNIRQMKADGERVLAHPAYSIYCAWDLMEYYDFCVAENLDIFWCELNHPEELDIRRHSVEIRQRAIEEIDRVVAKYRDQPGLSTDALERYKLTLEDPSYIDNTFFKPNNTLYWINRIEHKLKKTQKFQDLWPELARMIAC